MRPWELRFQSIVDEIKESITRIDQLATVGHLVLSSKIYQMAEEIACNQRILARRQSIAYQTTNQGLQNVLATGKSIEKSIEKMLLLSAESSQRQLEHADQTTRSREQEHEFGVGMSNLLLITIRPT